MIIFQLLPCKLLCNTEKETLYSNGGSSAPLWFYLLCVKGGLSLVSVLLRQVFLVLDGWNIMNGSQHCVWEMKAALPSGHKSPANTCCCSLALWPSIITSAACEQLHALICCFRVNFLLHSVVMFFWSSWGNDQSVSLSFFLKMIRLWDQRKATPSLILPFKKVAIKGFPTWNTVSHGPTTL